MRRSPRSHVGNAATGRRSPGQALAEFALVLIVLMLLVMGIVDLSRAVFIQSALANAAREGARYAIVHPSATDAEITEKAKAKIAGFDPDGVSVTVTPLKGEDGNRERVQVTATFTFHPVTGLIAYAAGIGPGGLELRGRSTMRLEAQ